MTDTRIVREVLAEATARLRQTSNSPRLDAELLLLYVTGLSRVALISGQSDTLSTAQIDHFFRLIARREKAEPIAYITGKKEFYGRDFITTPAVLCPRPETELLIESAIAKCRLFNKPIRFIDLGTGSGCIAITLIAELQAAGYEVYGTAVDCSAAALLVAYQNARLHGVTQNINIIRSNWFDSVAPEGFDLLVANPPYIPYGKGSSPELNFEPEGALYADENGLAAYRTIFKQLPHYVKTGSVILFEIGFDQGGILLEQSKKDVPLSVTATLHKDLAGHDRVLELQVL